MKKPYRKPKPLTKTRLYDLATHYVARFSTTSTKLEQYLKRKIRERGWEDEGEPDLAAIVERFVDLGYIDDANYARVKADGLLRRGYGSRRIADTLRHAGIAPETIEAVQPDRDQARQAALQFARKKRLGPFSEEPIDQGTRNVHIHRLARAGHGYQAAVAIVKAKTVEDAERWAEEG